MQIVTTMQNILCADRLRRLLRGETSATFADLTFWAEEHPPAANEVSRYLTHLTQKPDSAATDR